MNPKRISIPQNMMVPCNASVYITPFSPPKNTYAQITIARIKRAILKSMSNDDSMNLAAPIRTTDA